MNEATARILQPSVESAARIVAAKWPGVIDEFDAAQEIWLRLLESPGSEAQVLSMEKTTRTNALAAIGHQIANLYRGSHELFSGQVFYSTHDVREILNRSALTEEKTQTDMERMDLFEGLELLQERNERYAAIVFTVYALGESVADTKSVTRAVDSLTECMNRVHNSKRFTYESNPGARKVRSNSSARAISKSFYEDWDGRNGIQ